VGRPISTIPCPHIPQLPTPNNNKIYILFYCCWGWVKNIYFIVVGGGLRRMWGWDRGLYECMMSTMSGYLVLQDTMDDDVEIRSYHRLYGTISKGRKSIHEDGRMLLPLAARCARQSKHNCLRKPTCLRCRPSQLAGSGFKPLRFFPAVFICSLTVREPSSCQADSMSCCSSLC